MNTTRKTQHTTQCVEYIIFRFFGFWGRFQLFMVNSGMNLLLSFIYLQIILRTNLFILYVVIVKEND